MCFSGFSFQTSFHSNSCFSTYTFNSQRIKILLKRKNKTSILTGGRQRSYLLLTFFGAILGPLHIISTFLFPNPISTPSWPQSSLIGPCFSPGSLPSPRGTSRLLGTPPQVPGVPFQWHSGPCHKWRSWLGC